MQFSDASVDGLFDWRKEKKIWWIWTETNCLTTTSKRPLITNVWSCVCVCDLKWAGLDINVWPIVRYQWKLTSDKYILYYSRLTGQVKKSEILKRAGMTEEPISTGIKYWVCCIKEPCLISNFSIIYFD